MKRPNILFYFSDQQRADTCGCYGQSLPVTPRLDTLATEGVLFPKAFSPQPVCGPCRSVFQTGLYPTSTGCFRNNIALPSDVKTLGQFMTEAGYQTGYVGKWHLASEGPMEGMPTKDFRMDPIPLESRGGYTGFWRAADILEFTSNGYGGYVFDENMEKIKFEGYRTDCITDFALEFLDHRDKNTPFFLTVSHIEPHHQNDANHYQGPKDSKIRFKDFTLPGDLKVLPGDALEEYPDYLGACERVDYNLGRIIDRLKEQGIYDDTVIIFTSDHGSHFRTRNGDPNKNGYDDYKRSCHDASIHVPLVIRGLPYRGGRVIEDLVSTASLPKTILSLAGLSDTDQLFGENLLEVVDKLNPSRKNEVFVQISESRVGRAIRTPQYTYAVAAPNKNGGQEMNSNEYCDDFLYDLEKDPYQLNNLIDDLTYKQVKMDLRKALLEWIREIETMEPEIQDSLLTIAKT